MFHSSPILSLQSLFLLFPLFISCSLFGEIQPLLLVASVASYHVCAGLAHQALILWNISGTTYSGARAGEAFHWKNGQANKMRDRSVDVNLRLVDVWPLVWAKHLHGVSISTQLEGEGGTFGTESSSFVGLSHWLTCPGDKSDKSSETRTTSKRPTSVLAGGYSLYVGDYRALLSSDPLSTKKILNTVSLMVFDSSNCRWIKLQTV